MFRCLTITKQFDMNESEQWEAAWKEFASCIEKAKESASKIGSMWCGGGVQDLPERFLKEIYQAKSFCENQRLMY